MEELFKTTVAILNIFYDREEIEAYLNTVIGQIRFQMSELSKANLKAYFAIHQIALSEKELYFDYVNYARDSLIDYQTSGSGLTQIGEFLDECISNLKIAQFYVEDSLSLSPDTFDIFEQNEAEAAANIQAKEDSDPIFLDFLTSRKFALNNSSILKRFTDFKQEMMDTAESLKQSTAVKDSMALNLVADGLAAMVSYYNLLLMLRQAAELALSAMTEYNLGDRDGMRRFTSRNYLEIKKDLEAVS